MPPETEDQTETDLAERVRRLEATVAELQARVAALPPNVVPVAEPMAAEPVVRRDFETMATYWLGRAGIVALITGLAIFITFHFADFGATTRVFIGYSIAAALAGAGAWLSKRYSFFGHLVFGGGLAVAYFVTYALHFIASVRVVDSELAGLGLLALMVIGIVAGAQHFRSETVAGVGLFLGFHTSVVGETTIFGLAATWLLAAGAVFFLLKNRWVIVPLSSVVAVYTSHVVAAGSSNGALSSQDVLLGAGIILLYFVAFSVALLVRPAGLAKSFTIGFALTNILGSLAIGTWEIASSDRAWLAPYFATMTALLVGGAYWARRKRAGVLLEVHACAAVIVAGAFLLELATGAYLPVVWTLLGSLAVFVGARLPSLALRTCGAFVLCAASIAMFVEQGGLLQALLLVGALLVTKRLELPSSKPQHPVSVAIGVASALCAAVTLSRGLTITLPSSMTTLAWAGAAFVLVGLGMVLRDRGLRFAGLGLLVCGLVRLFVFDLSGLPTDARILTFVLLGVAMLAMSFAYTRFKDRLAHWL